MEEAAPAIVKDQALVKDWPAEREHFQRDPDALGGGGARLHLEQAVGQGFRMGWHSSQVVVGARTNITVNVLDRHANSENGNRAAFIWLAEDGAERIVTYRQLYRDVCRFANGLKSIGVKKGDRI